MNVPLFHKAVNYQNLMVLLPIHGMGKGEYYLYGVKMTKEEWQEARSQREGLPYYKNQSMKSKLSDYRN